MQHYLFYIALIGTSVVLMVYGITSAEKTALNALSVNIMQGDHNIYQLIPLN